MKLNELKEVVCEIAPVVILVMIQDLSDPLRMIEFEKLFSGEFRNIPKQIFDQDISVIIHNKDFIQIILK